MRHLQVWECTDDRPTWTVVKSIDNAHPTRINAVVSCAGMLISAGNDAVIKVRAELCVCGRGGVCV